MTEQARLKWTTNLIALSLPVVIAVGMVLLLIIGANTTMM